MIIVLDSFLPQMVLFVQLKIALADPQAGVEVASQLRRHKGDALQPMPGVLFWTPRSRQSFPKVARDSLRHRRDTFATPKWPFLAPEPVW